MTSPPPSPSADGHRGGPDGRGGDAVVWRVVDDHGPAAPFHQRRPDPGLGHQLWIRRLPGPALVLGSTQPTELVRRDRAADDGIEVCRRRSGGGLVYLDPATDCWIDAIVPADSPLWDDDIGRAFIWLGQLWADVLSARLGPAGPALVRRPSPDPDRRPPPLWCFDGLGHGEVTVGASKVVGLAQRRTREWIRLQSVVLGRWPGRRLLSYLDLDVAAEVIARRRPRPPDRTERTDGDRPGSDHSPDPGADHEPDRADDDRPGSDHSPDPVAVPEGADPGQFRAGPPTGIRLPDPDTLAGDLVERLAGVC